MGGGPGSQLLLALLSSAGFNSGFGLKDTWLSSLPRLQVRDGTKGTFSHLLPGPSSFSESLFFPIICSTDLGCASGSSCPPLCLPRASPHPGPPGSSGGTWGWEPF